MSPRGVGDIAKRRSLARSFAFLAYTLALGGHLAVCASVWSKSSERKKEGRKRPSEEEEETESYRGSCGSVERRLQKNWSLSISAVVASRRSLALRFRQQPNEFLWKSRESG